MNQKGFNLVGVMMGVGIGGIFLAGITSLLVNSQRDQARLSALFNVQQIQKNMSNMISSDHVWKSMIENNSSLVCLKSGSGVLCDHGKIENVTIYTGSGVEFFNPQKHGFTLNGVVCDLTKPGCDIKMKLEVELTCPGSPALATCAAPDQTVVKGVFALNTKLEALSVFNPENYLVQVRKDAFVAAASSAGGVVIQLKCVGSVPNDLEFSRLVKCTYVEGTVCIPPVCPPGFEELGLHNEGVDGFIVNCVRTCLKN